MALPSYIYASLTDSVDTVDWLTNPDILAALATLTILEIVLGIDNIVFISILSAKLPAHQQRVARRVGLLLALVGRIALLLSLTWIMRLEATVIEVFGQHISGRDLILLGGGLFLLVKATREIHDKLEGAEHGSGAASAAATFTSVIIQILLLDVVFSLDSVITAVGMAEQVWVMVTAIVIAIGIMVLSADAVSDFIDHHPTIKILALSFLLLIGVALIAESFEFSIPKGYLYFAMGFSIMVELLNLRMRRLSQRRQAVRLRASRRQPPQ